MTAQEVLHIVEYAGGRLTSNGERLTVEAPEPLPEDIMVLVRTHKADLLTLLNQGDDYDTAAPPILFDMQVRGQRVRAIAQASKNGYLYILNREN